VKEPRDLRHVWGRRLHGSLLGCLRKDVALCDTASRARNERRTGEEGLFLDRLASCFTCLGRILLCVPSCGDSYRIELILVNENSPSVTLCVVAKKPRWIELITKGYGNEDK